MLDVSQNELYIEGALKNKMPEAEYTIESSQINININPSYEQKKEKDLLIEKNTEMLIDSKESDKKEIIIKTKKKITKTNYVYKRFNNNYICNENQIKLKGSKTNKNITTSFNDKKLVKIDIPENKFTIDKKIDNNKENEIKEKIEKEMELKYKEYKENIDKQAEELKLKLEKETDDKLKEAIKKETEELQCKLQKENEKIKNKLHKDNEVLQNRLNKEAEEQVKEKINKE